MRQRQELRPELSAKCIELLYGQSSNAYLASIVAGAFLAALFWQLARREVIVGWALCYGLMIVYRHRLGLRFRDRTPGSEVSGGWLQRFTVAVLICGILWGLFAVYLAACADAYRLAAVVITLGMLVSGAVAAYAVMRSVFLAFSVPALIPLSLFLIARGSQEEVTLGVLVGAWVGFMYDGARRFRRFALESLDYQFENLQLVSDLAEQRDMAEDLAIQLKALSSTDALTGIPNRRQLDHELDKAWQRGLRDRSEIALILGDVDCFKLFNDTYGHVQGDGCLRQIAEVLSQHAQREGGVAARFGGEEFAVLLPKSDVDGALALAERIRKTIEALGIPHEASLAAKVVTGSFGVCCVTPTESFSIAQLIEMADQGLYAAKTSGRNRVARVAAADAAP